MNIRQRMVVVVMDLAILAELAYCMYLGSFDPEFQALFLLKTYVPVAVATLYAGRKVVRMLGPVAKRDWVSPLSTCMDFPVRGAEKTADSAGS